MVLLDDDLKDKFKLDRNQLDDIISHDNVNEKLDKARKKCFTDSYASTLTRVKALKKDHHIAGQQYITHLKENNIEQIKAYLNANNQ